MGMGIGRDVIGWLGVVLALTGFIVSALHLGRTRWAVPLSAGFALQTVVMGFNRLAVSFIGHGGIAAQSLQTAFLLSSLLGIVGTAAVVGGVAGVLSELKRASERPAAPAP